MVKSTQDTIASFKPILIKLDGIIGNLQAGKGTAGQLLNNPDLYNKLNATLDGLQTLERNINSGKGSIGKLITDDEFYNRLNETTGKLQDIADSLEAGKGSAGMLLKDDALYKNLNSTHGACELAAGGRGCRQGRAGADAEGPEVPRADLSSTLTQVNTLVSGVNAGKGTLGKFATDDAAYTNLNKLLTSSNELVAAIRTDPKKYLTIHLKIF